MMPIMPTSIDFFTVTSIYGPPAYSFSHDTSASQAQAGASLRGRRRRSESQSDSPHLPPDTHTTPSHRQRTWSQPDMARSDDRGSQASEPKKPSRLRKWLRSLTRMTRKDDSSLNRDLQVIEGREVEVVPRTGRALQTDQRRRSSGRWPRPPTPHPAGRLPMSSPPSYEASMSFDVVLGMTRGAHY